MIKAKNKRERKKGLSLSELLVVLGVTVVLSAILLPAIASTDPERAETILSAAATTIGFDGSMEPTFSAAKDKRMVRHGNRYDQDSTPPVSPRIDDVVSRAQENSRMASGVKKIATTDIRHP